MSEINMLILIQGKDSYGVHQKIKGIIDEHKKNNDLIVFFSEKEDFESVKNEISQNSIFEKKKVVVLNNLWNLIQKDKKLFSFFENIKDSKKTTIVFKEEKTDKKAESFFKKNGKIFNFELLVGHELTRWIQNEVNKRGGKISKEASDKLIVFTGNDLWLISNEIDKLVSYRNNELIEGKDIDLLTCPKIEGDIFKAIDFLASKNKKQAFNIFYRHIKKGDHALYLITMITFQFRNLISAKKGEQYGAKELEMHPFVFQKSVRLARSFSEKELKAIYEKILEAEINIKTGKTTPEVALDLLISEI